MVRCGRNSVRALRDHTRAGNVADNFCTRQMAADARLCALPHFDLDGGAGAEVILMHAEAAGRDLHDGICAVFVEIQMQTALAGVVVDAERFCGAGKAFVRIVADGAVGHGREHDRHGKLKLRGDIRLNLTVLVALDFRRLLTQKRLRFHRLTERVDGRVRDLRRVDEDFIPVDRQGLRVAHGRQQHAAAARLTVDLHDGLAGPVGIFLKGVVGLDDLQSARGTDGNAAVAVHTAAFVGDHHFQLIVVSMYFVGALSFTGTAGNAARGVADDLVLRI